MPTYTIEYRTKNIYTHPLSEAVYELLVLPVENSKQRIKKYQLYCNPLNNFYISRNSFGFKTTFIRYKNLSGEFSFHLKATVEKETVNPFSFKMLSIGNERFLINDRGFKVDNYLYLTFGKYTSLKESVGFPILRNDETIFDFSKRVMSYIFHEFTFDQSNNDPHRDISTTVNKKNGVCQDFAHLMLYILRNNGIPARYVSGYLNPGNNYQGVGAIHAWVQVLIPGYDWMGFDPTNNLLEDEHYIKIAHGVDFSDCTAIKGVLKGQGEHKTDYEVFVKEKYNKIDQ